ncbi:MAG: recombinase family protein, partial [Firmicutes bacterium]|nr:recombinase family protein [Bacillota bacterium]
TGKSVDNQITKCKACAVLRFDATDDDIVIYHDDGKSGFYADRPEYMRMLKDIENNRIRAVICYKFDRISRRTIDLLNLFERLKAKKMPLVSCSDNIDTSSASGKVLMSMLAVIAEFERDIIAERISDNLYELAKEGRWLGGVTPTGFVSKKEMIMLHGRKSTVNHLEPVADELITVKKIFDVFLERRSIEAVVKYMIHNEILTKTGKRHTRVSIRNILSNPVYAVADMDIYNYYRENGITVYAEESDFNGVNGLMVYNKTEQMKELKDDSYTLNPKYVHKRFMNETDKWVISVGKHKGLIQGRDWLTVQEIMKDNREQSARPHIKTRSLLSGIIACPVCGKNLFAHKETKRFEEDGSPKFLYKCQTRRVVKSDCSYMPIQGNKIDNFILDTLCKIGSTNSDEYYNMLEEEIRRNSYDVIADEARGLREKIKTLKRDIESQTQTLRTIPDNAKKYIIDDIGKMSEELSTAEKQLEVFSSKKTENKVTLDGLNKARELVNSFESLIKEMTYEEKMELVRLIIAKVYVVNKDYITDDEGNEVKNDEVHIFLKGCPDEDYTEFFRKNNPIKQKNNDEEVVSKRKGDTAFLFCRNVDNMLLPLIHIVVPVRELLEEATVGEKIAFYRCKVDLTQRELAEMLEINRITMVKYENNIIDFNMNILHKISVVLGVPPTFLYDDYFSFIASPASKIIKNYRETHQMTQKEFAKFLNVSKREVERWESQNTIPSRDNYEKIRKILY